MLDTIEKPKHKPVTDMLKEFQKFYAIRLRDTKPKPNRQTFVTDIKTSPYPHILINGDIANAKLCSAETIDTVVARIRDMLSHTEYGKHITVNKVLVDVQ